MTPRTSAETLKLALLVVDGGHHSLFDLVFVQPHSHHIRLHHSRHAAAAGRPAVHALAIDPRAVGAADFRHCLCCSSSAAPGYLFGTRIADEFQDVVQRATSASAAIQSSLSGSDFGKFLLKHFSGDSISVTGVLSGVLRVSTSFLEAFIIMVISGIYLAAQPRLYRKGLIWLFPPAKHARAAEIIDGVGEALRLWLLGQLIQMLLIGALVTFAVWLIGVPSSLALGLIAGIGEFIPYLGPILAAIPAILVALTKSPELTSMDAGGLFDHSSDRRADHSAARSTPNGLNSTCRHAAWHRRD